VAYTPNYPTANVTFTSQERTDGIDIVSAIDINPVYGELKAVANTLGLDPQTRSSSNHPNAWGTGTFSTAATTTVDNRISNVENGIYVVINDYISRSAASGANTIQPSGTTTVNLTLKPQTSQTADLLQAYVGSTAVTKIKSDGTFWTSVIDGGSA
jgi:hypothetical protein